MRPNHSQDAVAAHIHTMAAARAVERESRPKDNPLQVREAHPRGIPLQSCQIVCLAGHGGSVTRCGYNRKRIFPPSLVALMLRFTVSPFLRVVSSRLCCAFRIPHSAFCIGPRTLGQSYRRTVARFSVPEYSASRIPRSALCLVHSYSRTFVLSYFRTLFSSRVFRIPNSALRIVSCTFVLSYLHTLVRSCFNVSALSGKTKMSKAGPEL